MRTDVEGSLRGTAAAATAEAVIGACVHCGLCNAACPTYRLTGDELDGPRGRIYLMKAALEGEPVGPLTLNHLDRCLECRACESACPSGVEYHRLLDVGRGFVGRATSRAPAERWTRRAIRFAAAHPGLLAVLFRLGRLARFALPRRWAEKVPPANVRGAGPKARRSRRMLILGGCVQQAAAGGFNAATARVFDRLGISLVQDGGCCGAVPFHLQAEDEARGVKKAHENPAIGVLLCASKDAEVVEYALSRSLSPALVTQYQTQLPDKKLLQAKLHEFYLQNVVEDEGL